MDDDNNNWSDMSDDIGKVAKNFKGKMEEEDLKSGSVKKESESSSSMESSSASSSSASNNPSNIPTHINCTDPQADSPQS